MNAYIDSVDWRRRRLKRRQKEQQEKKRRGLGLKPLIIGMSACTVLLGGVLSWAVLGSIHRESKSGHGLGIVDAVNNMELQKKAEVLAAKPSAASSESQTLTADETDSDETASADAANSDTASDSKKENNSTEAQEKDKQNNDTSEDSSAADEESAQGVDENENQEASELYQQINKATMANPASGVTDVTTLETVTADEVCAWIESYTYGEWSYLDDAEVTQAETDEILSRRNLDGISDPISISYGVITQNAAVRAFPTWRKAAKSLDANAFDYIQESMLLTGEPVAVVHQTADGVWSFVQATNYRGWVETSRIAFCTLDELQAWQTEDRAVVTDATLTLSDTALRMGTALPASVDEDGTLTVSIPQTDENGLLTVKEVQTTQEGIQFGYLELTEANVLDQARKLIGTAYGWGDSNGDMDCSSTMNSIYRCFGIILPRNTSELAQTGTEIVSLEGMTQEEKLEQIHSMKLGTLLVMKGHVVMYIGQEDGQDMILHNFTTCLAEDGVSKEDVYQCRITPLNLITAAGTQYLDVYATAVCFPEE